MTQHFGSWFRRVRLGRDVSLGQLGRGVGCKTPYIYRIEHGKSPPSVKFIEATCEFLELDRLEAFSRAGKLPPEQAVRFSTRPILLGRLLAATDRLNDKQLEILVRATESARKGRGAPAARRGHPN